MKKSILFITMTLLLACKSKVEKIHPTQEAISESVYASGILKSKNQYHAFATVSGVIEQIYVEEGDSVKIGTNILSIANETQLLNKENALLVANFSDIQANQGKLSDAKQSIELANKKMKNDSALFVRQQSLWKQQIGSRIDLEQKELAFQNSKNIYFSAIQQYNDLKRQLDFSSSQSKTNLQLSGKLANDYTLKSEIDGIIYGLNKSKGDLVGPQTDLAVIGSANEFVLEMEVDEYDILKIKKNQLVMVTLDSYKGKVFEARVTKINPLMNERSKTFTIEASFVEQPSVLYPNVSFEASIVLQSKSKAILIPRNFIEDDSIVYMSNGDKVKVKTGLRDYQKIEILSGISINDELIKPSK